MSPTKANRVAVLVCCILTLGGSGASAQNSPSITVTGIGKIMILPNVVELQGMIQGNKGALAGDAFTSFSDVKQEATLALQELMGEGLEVSNSAFSVGTPQDSNPSRAILRAARGEQPPEAEVAVRETMKIRISGVDQMDHEQLVAKVIKIIDAGKESGLSFSKPPSLLERTRGGPASYLSFRRTDLDELGQQADGLAMKHARSQAEKIARLADLSVGKIISIEEIRIPTVSSSLRAGDPHTLAHLEKIKVEKHLRIRFALIEDAKSRPQASGR